jgi:hypothetical protein
MPTWRPRARAADGVKRCATRAKAANPRVVREPDLELGDRADRQELIGAHVHAAARQVLGHRHHPLAHALEDHLAPRDDARVAGAARAVHGIRILRLGLAGLG